MNDTGSRPAADVGRIVRFGSVGAVGFLVDGGLLQALVAVAGWGPIAARLLSFPVAVFATWLLNRNLTFREYRHVPAARSLARYVAVSLAGAGVNFAVYTSLVLWSSNLAARPIAPLAVASIVAMAVNYLGSKHLAFR